MKFKKPNVLVAGFPRSGSTYLYNILNQHPDIFIPSIKEINYFNKDHFFMGNPEILNPRYFKPKKWYYKFFKTDKKVVIDFSILSALDMSSAIRVKKELGDIKIIFVTRNLEDYRKSIEKMLDMWNEPKEASLLYLDLNDYIKNYKTFFSKVYVISMENFNKNPQLELKKVTKFLELENYHFDLKVIKHETKGLKPVGSFQLARRKIYIGLVDLFYKFLELNVKSLANPERKNE